MQRNQVFRTDVFSCSSLRAYKTPDASGRAFFNPFVRMVHSLMTVSCVSGSGYAPHASPTGVRIRIRLLVAALMLLLGLRLMTWLVLSAIFIIKRFGPYYRPHCCARYTDRGLADPIEWLLKPTAGTLYLGRSC